MPVLRNPKHEKFAQLVASGMTAQAAFTQAGYQAPQNAPRLRNSELVAKRIEELQTRNERKAEMAAMTRDDLVKILAETVQAARSRLSDTRISDGLKAAELLTKLCGWNEPEKRDERHLHGHFVVDKAVLAQLRAGLMELQGANARMKLAQGAETVPGIPRTPPR